MRPLAKKVHILYTSAAVIYELNQSLTCDVIVNQRLWVVGGGYIGDSGNRQVLSMQGSVNTYWSKDGINWVLVNFVQGGGITGLSLYSSNEWSRTTIDGVVVFLGLWGLTLNVFSPVDASGNRVVVNNVMNYH